MTANHRSASCGRTELWRPVALRRPPSAGKLVELCRTVACGGIFECRAVLCDGVVTAGVFRESGIGYRRIAGRMAPVVSFNQYGGRRFNVPPFGLGFDGGSVRRLTPPPKVLRGLRPLILDGGCVPARRVGENLDGGVSLRTACAKHEQAPAGRYKRAWPVGQTCRPFRARF